MTHLVTTLALCDVSPILHASIVDIAGIQVWRCTQHYLDWQTMGAFVTPLPCSLVGQISRLVLKVGQVGTVLSSEKTVQLDGTRRQKERTNCTCLSFLSLLMSHPATQFFFQKITSRLLCQFTPLVF
uniref:Uncharacterized protein n=1 Tax=Rhipicephalus zambeziensis TaxID=60191 RepID=A0A224YH53_9ACAR